MDREIFDSAAFQTINFLRELVFEGQPTRNMDESLSVLLGATSALAFAIAEVEKQAASNELSPLRTAICLFEQYLEAPNETLQ